MLISLQQGVVEYLAGKFPNLSVSRSFSPRFAMTEMQKDADAGTIRVVVAPPSRTGEDVPASRGTIQRVVGVDVGILIKPKSWENDHIDPFVNQVEEIRKAMWEIPGVPIADPGYSPARFTRLDDQFCGVPEDNTRLFVAIFTPSFYVTCKAQRG